MELSKAEIEHIAHLARIEMTQQEKENFSGQLSDILNYLGQLKKVNTDNVMETARVSELSNCLAEDIVRVSEVDQQALLSNVPDRLDNYIKVRTVLEQ